MITVNDLTLSWGAFTLLDHINIHIGDNEKIGLVGKNGAGKSTLLKLILGEVSPTSGTITKTKGERIGYLPQQMGHAKDKTVMEETMKAFDSLFSLHARIGEITSQLSERTDYQSNSYNNLIVELNNVQDRISMMESEPPASQAEKVLTGLGFRSDEFDRPTRELSQGWNMRIELAKILLSKPDCLLLDEPTNHLDIESIQWFENYLKNFKGSVLLISHDRKFLDSTTSRTIEIMLSKVHDYKVPYSKYKILRKERMEQQRSAYEIEKTEEFIERFRYKATKSNQVQSRIKALDKLERIEVDLEDKTTLTVKFPPAPRSGQVVFKSEDLAIGYGEHIVASKINVTIERGEKVAFVGRNGEGKTTMMRILIGELDKKGGTVENGYNVVLGYYAQNQEDILDKNETVYSTLENAAPGEYRQRLRDILGAFLFKGEDVDKKVAVLSGGERARLAMAKLILKPYNLLCLDEPTNHMDIQSKDILKQALQKYDGTLVIVSHDRDFLNGLVDKVYEFRDGKVKEHLGGIVPYLEHLEKDLIETVSPAVKEEAKKSEETASKPKDSQIARAESKEERRRRKEVEKLENEIAELDFKIEEIEMKLSSPESQQQVEELSKEYSRLKDERDQKLDKWMEAAG